MPDATDAEIGIKVDVIHLKLEDDWRSGSRSEG